MAIDLHYDPISAPCRAVILTAKMVGVELNLKIVSLLAQEQMKPEFIKINPQHTVPVIDDSGFILTESRAICAYLINKYAKNDKLYPKSAKERSVVDQRLFFDLGVFYPGFSDYYYPILFFGATTFDEKKKKSLEDGINYLNMFLNEHDYVACDHFTVADLALTVSAAVMEAVDSDIFKNHPKITEWMERCKNQIPNYHELNQVGTDMFAKMAKNALSKMSISSLPNHEGKN